MPVSEEVQAWIDYETARGNNAPSEAEEPLASAAYLRGEDYVRIKYLTGSYDLEETDEAVVEAIKIAATFELSTPGFWSTTYTPAQAKVLTGLGSLRWTINGENNTSADHEPVSPRIEALLSYGKRGTGIMVLS